MSVRLLALMIKRFTSGLHWIDYGAAFSAVVRFTSRSKSSIYSFCCRFR